MVTSKVFIKLSDLPYNYGLLDHLDISEHHVFSLLSRAKQPRTGHLEDITQDPQYLKPQCSKTAVSRSAVHKNRSTQNTQYLKTTVFKI